MTVGKAMSKVSLEEATTNGLAHLMSAERTISSTRDPDSCSCSERYGKGNDNMVSKLTELLVTSVGATDISTDFMQEILQRLGRDYRRDGGLCLFCK